MDLNKKVNNFGIFGSVVIVNNNVVTSAATMPTDDDELATKIAVLHTSEALQKSSVAKEINDRLLMALTAFISTDVTVITPNKNDIKAFIAAVIQTAEDGNMAHMRNYERETGSNIPQDIWDYIYELTNN